MKKCYGCFENVRDDLEVCPYCGYIEGTPPEEAIHMEPGTILAERYIIGKVLGYGGFGVTYLAWDAKLEQKVAVKEYLPSEFSTRIPGQSRISIFNGTKNEQFTSGLNKFIDEAKRLSRFQNEEGIVRVFDCIAENDTAYIIMEYLEGETLAERLKRDKRIPEKEAIEIMMPVMKSLEVVHKEGIIHRDIAPDNVFITTDGRVKLIDFGAARFATTSHSRSLTVVIKPGFSAEEQYRSRSDQGPYTDVYAIAATLYKMITGETPPDALERRAKLENSKRDILHEPHKIYKNISAVTENAILNALNIRIEDRTPTIEQFIEDLTADAPVKRAYGKIKKIDLYRMPLWIKILSVSLMTVFLAFAAMLATGVIKFSSMFKKEVEIPEGYTVVPNIEGMDFEKAIVQLKGSNLNYTTGGNVTSDYITANLIVYQSPESGKMMPVNSLIELTVSRGTGVVTAAKDGVSTVPIYVWSAENTAVEDFKAAGLVPTVEYIFDENVGAGQVVRATDTNGVELTAGYEVAEGTEVILYVSKGPEGFSMPNVVGYTEKDAKSTLENLGLVVSVIYVENPDTAEGTVFDQSIAANTNVTLGTAVELSVATTAETTETKKSLFATDTPVPTPTPLPNLTVNFDSNGGSSVSSITRKYGEKIGSLPTPTKDGHTFNGWVYNGSTVSSSTTVTSNMTVIASWTANTYTISFNSKGGSSVSSITRTYGESLGTLPSPTREGYTFGGWKYNGSKVKFDTTVTSDMELVATWSANTYDITFDSAGGSSVDSFTRKYGETLGSLTTPSREGYTFNGWTYNGSTVSADTVVKSNMTLTASWTIITYTIKFDSNGGSSVSSITRKYGETLGSLSSPTRDYYNFSGWTYNGSSVSSSTVVKSDMTLKASWTEKGWSDWSSWSTTAVSESYSNGLLVTQVESNYHPATYKTQYHYDRYYCYWAERGYYLAHPKRSGDCINYEETNWLDSPLPTNSGDYYNGSYYVEYGRKYSASGVAGAGKDIYWYNQTTRQVEASSAYTEYRYRTRIK